jgi:integrase/recombinase XerD
MRLVPALRERGVQGCGHADRARQNGAPATPAAQDCHARAVMTNNDPRKPMNNVDLIRDFVTWKQRNQGRSERTAEMYGDTLLRLVRAMDERSLLELNAEDLVLFTGPLLHKQGVNALSRRPHIAAIRGFFKWAKRTGHVRADPAATIDYPKHGRKLPRLISLANAEKLMWSIDFSTFHGVRDSAMLGLLIGCGLRISGLLDLTREQIVSTTHEGKPRLCIRTMEKGERQRQIPVPEPAEVMLRVYLEHPALKSIDCLLADGSHLLFVSTKNSGCPEHEFHGARRRLSRKTVAHMIQRRGTKAGIPQDQLHAHAMRHLFGTELAESDIDILQRMDLMGHRNAKSTEIYEQVAMRKRFTIMDSAAPLAKMTTPVSEVLQRLQAASPKKS